MSMIAGSFSVNLGTDAFWFAVILSKNYPLFAGLSVFDCRSLHLTIWFSPELTWYGNERIGKTGRPTRYCDYAIQTILTLKALFSQALRQIRGLVVSLVRQLKLNWNVPCYSTVSRGVWGGMEQPTYLMSAS